MDGILTQEEVDALLSGLNPGETSFVSGNTTKSGVHTLDFSRQERIVRGRMPALDLIHERFIRELRTKKIQWLRKAVDVSIHSFNIMKYYEFIKTLPMPAHMNVFNIEHHRGYGLVVIDPQLAFLWIDYLFGGNGRLPFRIEGREFSATEQRIILQGLDLIFQSYEKAWEPVLPLKTHYIRTEIHTQFLNVMTPTDLICVLELMYECDGRSHGIFIALPYSMLEPHKELLQKSHWVDATESHSERWQTGLSHALHQSDVEVEVKLGESVVSLEDLLHLKKGDVILLDIHDTLMLTSRGVPIASGKQGIYQGHYAFQCKNIYDKNEDI